MERTRKIPTKELNNRYFVSGIQLLSNLSQSEEYSKYFSKEVINKAN